jgi:N-acetylmuramoyl-L-alanine amidase
MSRRNDSYIPLHYRVELAEKSKAVIFVSIHTNSCPNKRISGAEIYFYANPKNSPRVKSSKQLAICIGRRFAASLPIKPRGVKAGNLYVIRETTMPAVLIESAFMTNAGEARLLTLPSFKTKLALAIAKGVDDYVHSR